MLTYTIRRLILAVPTLLFIALVIFLLLELAPGDPMAEMPLTIPPEVKEKMREALGLGQPWYVRFYLWLYQFFIVEPQYWIDGLFGTNFADGAQRIISFQSRSPVFNTIAERIPQTLWVVGMSYVVGVIIALPIGIISAVRQYSWFDNFGTFISMVGFSVPTFFTGVLLIVIFSVNLGWFPSIYDTTLKVNDWPSFVKQLKQMAMIRSWPSPFTLNTCSVMIAPPKTCGTPRAMTVTTGISELRRTCFRTTTFSVMPLARAVRT
jgi:peptide/nickel transport system permease protein